MNDVASLELSKELYELSGWEPSEFLEHGDYSDLRWWHDKYEKPEVQNQLAPGWASIHNNIVAPAYCLGYLLRKLPEEIDKKVLVILPGERPHIGYAERDNYGYYTLDDRFYRDAWSAINLEDAAAELAIELFKQGVLKKEVA